MKNKDVDLIKKMEKENIQLREVKVVNEKLKKELDDLQKKYLKLERENGELVKSKGVLRDELESQKASNTELHKQKVEMFEQINKLKAAGPSRQSV